MTEAPTAPRGRAFAYAAWGFLGWLLFVIVYGAWVRISFSGAGCGSHWPLCDGEVLPTSPDTEKLIEFTHRVTSGLAGIWGLVLLIWSVRLHGRRHRVFRATLVTFVFLLVEAALGAVLVLAGLVVRDDSTTRALVVALHLANTLMLTGAAGLTAWFAQGQPAPRLSGHGRTAALLGAGLAALLLTSMAGAVTALGDTLFPVGSAEAASGARHFLVRLRVLHPVIALLSGFFLLWLAGRLRIGANGAAVSRGAWTVSAMVLAALIAGGLNVVLAAPAWLQLFHLLLAQGAWLATLLTASARLALPPAPAGAAPATAPARAA